ncbi:hypothetical protein HDU96_000245, partial [Phlyctochytrium bullatum]
MAGSTAPDDTQVHSETAKVNHDTDKNCGSSLANTNPQPHDSSVSVGLDHEKVDSCADCGTHGPNAPAEVTATATKQTKTEKESVCFGGWHISRTLKEDATLANDWDGSWDYPNSLGIHLCRLTVILPLAAPLPDPTPSTSSFTIDDPVQVRASHAATQPGSTARRRLFRWPSWLTKRLTFLSRFRPPRPTPADAPTITEDPPASPPPRDTHAAELTRLFALARAASARFILRFHYANGGDPPTLDYLQSDLRFFADLVRANVDVVLCVQAGFLGRAWGEWWGSRWAPDEDFGEDREVERAKRMVVEAFVGAGVQVCVRYPRDIANYFLGNPLVGWHNDAILAQGPCGPDAGTFDKGSKTWRNNDILTAQSFTRTHIHGIRGGECCNDAGTPPTLDALLTYVRDFRIEYLNAEYPPEIFERVRAEVESGERGQVEEIRRAMVWNARERGRRDREARGGAGKDMREEEEG